MTVRPRKDLRRKEAGKVDQLYFQLAHLIFKSPGARTSLSHFLLAASTDRKASGSTHSFRRALIARRTLAASSGSAAAKQDVGQNYSSYRAALLFPLHRPSCLVCLGRRLMPPPPRQLYPWLAGLVGQTGFVDQARHHVREDQAGCGQLDAILYSGGPCQGADGPQGEVPLSPAWRALLPPRQSSIHPGWLSS
jgi:hypothetical protein